MEQFFAGNDPSEPQFRERPIHEMKVIFLGDGGSGKSHIIARLLLDGKQTEDFPGLSTPGIRVQDKTYTMDGGDFRVHFWDFGGQEILHSMHRLFLTNRTLYVVVLNVRDGNQDERARYWLHNVRSFATGSPVLLVLNMMDMNKNASVNERGLREMYPDLNEVVKLSALRDSRAEFEQNFHAALKRQIVAFGSVEMPFLPAWNRLKNTLQKMSEPYIRGDEYRNLCDECGVTANDAVRRDLLHWFNNLGVSFCYQDSARLEDFVVLRPEWVTNAIYAIVWNAQRDASNGVISHSHIYRLLRTAQDREARVIPAITYRIEEIDYILQVMRKFRLSFRIDDETEFIPMLCIADASPIVYEYASDPDTLEFRMEYEYLPGNVLHRLMVELRRDLDLDHVWRTGARFFSGALGVSAVVCSEGDQLRILVRSQNQMHSARTYLEIIRENLARISQQMGLTPADNRVIYKADGIVESFDYDMLVEMMEYGETTTFSRKFRKRIAIQDILNQTDSTARNEKKLLLRNILAACSQMQDHKLLWEAKEDERNCDLRDLLIDRGYLVMDQTLRGDSRSAWRLGELDLDIRRDPGTPWAICEGLTLKSAGSASRNYWEDHLKKLLYNYAANPVVAFMVCYVECSRDNFQRVCETYLSRLRSRAGSDAPVHYAPVDQELMGGWNPMIAAAQCIYDLRGFPYEVYHIFVRMGE